MGDSIKVQIIKVNKETNRISLGMKQLEVDPWADVEARFPIGSNQKGTVTNITDYGAFVELEGWSRRTCTCFRNVLDKEKRSSWKDIVN